MDPNNHEIALESRPLVARDNRTNIAIWPDQHPSAWFEAIAVPDMSTVVDDISARTERVDVQTGARV